MSVKTPIKPLWTGTRLASRFVEILNEAAKRHTVYKPLSIDTPELHIQLVEEVMREYEAERHSLYLVIEDQENKINTLEKIIDETNLPSLERLVKANKEILELLSIQIGEF